MNALKQIPRLRDDYERCLVGSVILDPTLIDTIGATINASHFIADPIMGRIWSLLANMRAAGVPIDAVTLRQRCIDSGIIGPAFTIADLAKVFDAVTHPGHAPYYASQVASQAARIRLLGIAQEIIEDANDTTDDPTEIARRAESRLSTIGVDQGRDTESIGDAATRLLDLLEAQSRDSAARSRAVYTGLYVVDEITGGVCPGELVVVAARPGNGKTSLAMQVALRAARHGQGVLFASLEMTTLELVARVVCGMTDVSSADIRDGKLTADQLRQIVGAAAELQDVGIEIFDRAGATINQIAAVAKLHRASGRALDLLVVDYVGLIRSTSRDKADWERLTEISNAAKCLAKEMQIPVLLLSQLNRESDQHTEPRLSHLARSGALEQDADQVWFLYRRDAQSAQFTFIVAKNRHGGIGKVPVMFDARRTRFSEGQEWTP